MYNSAKLVVTMPNTDLGFWDLEYRIADIIQILQKHDTVIVDLNNEGPCCEALGLYKRLDYICERFGFDSKNIYIRTGNQLECSSRYNIIKTPPNSKFISDTQRYTTLNDVSIINWDNKIQTFGLFVGRSSWQRLILAAHLTSNCRDKSLVTYHFDIKNDYNKPFIGLDDILRNLNQHCLPNEIVKLLEQSPLLGPDIPKYPILTPEHHNIAKIYDQFFLEIICETYCLGNTFFPTEKTWRPLANRKPFIIYGPRDYYHNLKKLGFRTFSNWWDEGFTNDDHITQIEQILKIIDTIAAFDQSQLEALHIDMQETLEHNYQRMRELSPNEFKKIWP